MKKCKNLNFSGFVIKNYFHFALAYFFLTIVLAYVRVGISNLGYFYFPDDSFYYYSIARGFVNHNLLSVDGVNLASGFHPVWMLVCIFLEFFINNNNYLQFSVFILSFFLYFVSAIYLKKIIVCAFWSERARALAIILIILNPVLIFYNWLNGLESAIFLTSFIFLVWTFLYDKPLRYKFFFSGLVILSRLDFIVIAGPLYLFLAYLSENKKNKKELLLLLFFSFFLLLLYFTMHKFYFGDYFPASASAMRYMSEYKFIDLIRWSHTGFYFDYPIHFVQFIKNVGIAVSTSFGIAPQTFNTTIYSKLLLISFVVYFFCSKKFALNKDNIKIIYSFLMLIVVFSIYISTLRAFTFRPWYFGIYSFLISFGFILIFEKIISDKDILVFFLISLTSLFLLQTNPIPPLNRASFISNNQSFLNHEFVGSFNSGIYSFADPRIINLDGLANQNAFLSLKKKKLCNYMKDTNIKYLVDVTDKDEIESDVNNASFNCVIRLIPLKVSADGIYNEAFYKVIYN
jgi:hypothetical protein